MQIQSGLCVCSEINYAINFLYDLLTSIFFMKKIHFLAPPEQPSAPFLISNLTRETVDVTWMAPKDQGGAPIESYFIEKRDLETMH